MPNTYRKQTDQINNEKTKEILNELPDFVQDFFTSMIVNSKSSRTILEYAYEIKCFLIYVSEKTNTPIKDISEKNIEELTASFIERYLGELSKSQNTLSENTRARKLSALRSFYGYYYKNKRISSNPCQLVDMTKKHKKDVEALSRDEIAALIEVVENGYGLTEKEMTYYEKTKLRDKAIIYVLTGTGMRVSELCGLDILDYDYDNACLNIIRKGGNFDKVFVGETVEEVLLEYLEHGRDILKPYQNETALFVSLQGKRMSVRSVEKMVKKYAILANLPSSTHAHTLRASFATSLYEETGDVYMIKEALNHSSLETSKHYIGGSTERKRKAARISNNFFTK